MSAVARLINLVICALILDVASSGWVVFTSTPPFLWSSLFLVAHYWGKRTSEWLAALQRQNAENLKQIFPEKEYRGLSPNFHIQVSVSSVGGKGASAAMNLGYTY
jgi:hypothetical protein